MSYWGPRPAGLGGQWWVGFSFLCLPQSLPAPPSRFSPTGALRRQMEEQTDAKHNNQYSIQQQCIRFFSQCSHWMMIFTIIKIVGRRIVYSHNRRLYTGSRTNFIIEWLLMAWIVGYGSWVDYMTKLKKPAVMVALLPQSTIFGSLWTIWFCLVANGDRYFFEKKKKKELSVESFSTMTESGTAATMY